MYRADKKIFSLFVAQISDFFMTSRKVHKKESGVWLENQYLIIIIILIFINISWNSQGHVSCERRRQLTFHITKHTFNLSLRTIKVWLTAIDCYYEWLTSLRYWTRSEDVHDREFYVKCRQKGKRMHCSFVWDIKIYNKQWYTWVRHVQFRNFKHFFLFTGGGYSYGICT